MFGKEMMINNSLPKYKRKEPKNMLEHIHNGSFCHLWGILNLQGPKKQKSTENERYGFFKFIL